MVGPSRSRTAAIAGLVALVAVAAPAALGDADLALAERLRRGAEVYAFSCTTCHGATGAGFAEARAAFPADHARCERCHVPLNPPQLTPAEIRMRQTVFSLGDAPPLDGIGRFGSVEALRAHVAATMPRWAPGTLGGTDYDDVALYLWVRHATGGADATP